jgi:protein subunit release factor A
MNPDNEHVKFATDRDSLERDCEVDFFTGPGPGGQHRNRSRTGVRLTHRPSGLTVTATERRSQSQNIEAAYQRLADRLAELNRVPKKRRPTRPGRAARERRLRAKAQRSEKKDLRKKPRGEE